MICVIAIAGYINGFQEPSIRFVSPDKSPFIGTKQLVESRPSEQPGIVVFEEQGIATELHLSLRKALAETKIISLIQKTGENEFTTVPKFDVAGYRKGTRISQEISIPGSDPAKTKNGDWFDNLKIGEASLMFECGDFRRESMPLEWHPNIAGIIIDPRIAVEISNDRPFGQKGFGGWGTSLMSLGNVASPFVNIRFTAKIYDFMGTMDTKIGDSKTVDGVKFQVAKHSKLNFQAEEPFAVFVKQTGRAGKWWYQLEPAVRDADDVATWKSYRTNFPFKMPPENNALDKVQQAEITIRGTRAVKDWHGINILRCTEISGYYSHVPTRPGLTP